MVDTSGMKRDGRLCRRSFLAAVALMAIGLQGCISVQIFSQDGKPKLIGFGYAKPVDGTDGQIYQIVAPGLSARIHSLAPGLSLGWHETRLFYPPTSGQTGSFNQPVAIQNRCVGINLTPSQIMFGIERSFVIPLPPEGSNVIQFISYSAKNPTNTIVERKEMK